MIIWGVKLKDEVSSPAKAAASAMGSASQQAKTLATAVRGAQAAFAKAVALGDMSKVSSAFEQFKKLEHALHNVEGRAGPFTRAWNELKGKVSERWRIEFDPLEWARTGAEAVHALTETVVELIATGLEAAETGERLRAVFG